MPKRCPRCSSISIVQHCASPTCTWAACNACRSFGTADGEGWTARPTADA